MYETIGFLELNSIAKGIEAADAILKAAETELIFARASCPGKYYILFTGEVAAVTASIEAGALIGGANTVDKCVIPRVHPQVIAAINSAVEPVTTNALGVMEFFSVTAAVYAADAAVKAADVKLMDVRYSHRRGCGCQRVNQLRHKHRECRGYGCLKRCNTESQTGNF